MKTRKLKDGTVVQELVNPKVLEVKTKCPEKWMLVDLETGERYIGYSTSGSLHWKRIEDARY